MQEQIALSLSLLYKIRMSGSKLDNELIFKVNFKYYSNHIIHQFYLSQAPIVLFSKLSVRVNKLKKIGIKLN